MADVSPTNSATEPSMSKLYPRELILIDYCCLEQSFPESLDSNIRRDAYLQFSPLSSFRALGLPEPLHAGVQSPRSLGSSVG